MIRASFSTHYVQEGLTFFDLATTNNTGLFTQAVNSTPTGVFSGTSTNSQIPQPIGGSFPVSQLANWINFGGSSSLLNFDPNLRTPYVFEWNFPEFSARSAGTGWVKPATSATTRR